MKLEFDPSSQLADSPTLPAADLQKNESGVGSHARALRVDSVEEFLNCGSGAPHTANSDSLS